MPEFKLKVAEWEVRKALTGQTQRHLPPCWRFLELHNNSFIFPLGGRTEAGI
jgi:hypothetical protein